MPTPGTKAELAALVNLNKSIAQITEHQPSAQYDAQKLNQMRSFAGNDLRILKRLPFAEAKRTARRELIAALLTAQAALITYLEADEALQAIE